MAKDKNETQGNSQVDNETLLENMKGLELENKMLKDQKQKLEEQIAENSKTINELQANNNNNAQYEAQVSELEEQVQNLANERNDLAQQLEDLKKLSTGENDHLVDQINELKLQNTKLVEDYQTLQQQHQSLQEHVSGLIEQNKKEPKMPERAIVLTPFAFGILKRLREKLVERYNKPDLTLNAILEDYLIKYNCLDKWTEWFHPFVLSEKEIIEIGHKINPNIKSIKDLRIATNIQ